MAIAKLTLQGMLLENPNLFDGVEFPEPLDNEVIKAAIMQYCYERPLIITDPFVLGGMIANWCEMHKHNFVMLARAMLAEYNPIENYDMNESHSESASGNANATTTTSSNGQTINTVSAFDSEDFVNNEKIDTTDGGTTSTTGGNSQNTSGTIHRHGNMGVTTTQQMIESSIALETRNNFYKIIADNFASEFCYYLFS